LRAEKEESKERLKATVAARCLFADYPPVWQLWARGGSEKILPLCIFMICLRLLLHAIWQVAVCLPDIF
jgi:hypothetical protein